MKGNMLRRLRGIKMRQIPSAMPPRTTPRNANLRIGVFIGVLRHLANREIRVPGTFGFVHGVALHLTWDRQSPDWRLWKRQSGDWRTQGYTFYSCPLKA